MRYSIAIEPQSPECHVEIHCSQVNREVEGILQALVLTETTVAGQAGEETRFIPISQVLYFESVDDKTYLYTHDEVLSCDLRMISVMVAGFAAFQFVYRLIHLGFPKILDVLPRVLLIGCGSIIVLTILSYIILDLIENARLKRINEKLSQNKPQ